MRARLGIPDDAVVAAFVATLDRAHHFKRLDVAIEALARSRATRRVAPGRRRRRRAARRLPRQAARRRRRRARPLPRRRPPRRAAGRAAGRRPVPAHHRAAGVVRDRPDRGDGLRPARDRHRLPGRARGRRRRRDRHRWSRRATPAPSPRALSRLVEAGPPGGPAWARPGARRPSGSGAGRALLDRMDAAYAEAIALAAQEDRVNLLLVAYFYPPVPRHRRPPARGDGQVAATARAPGHGADDVRLRRPADADVDEGVVRTPDLQRLRARLHGHDRVDALFDSDTYSGQPAPPEQGDRARAARRRLDAVRAPARRCGSIARDRFDCVITSSPPESAHAVGRALRAARRPLGGGPPRRLDLRADPPALSDRAPAPPRRARSNAAGSAPPTRSSASAAPAAEDLRERLGIDPALVPNGWDPDLIADASGHRRADRPPRPRPDLARLHRPLRQLRPRPGPARRAPARELARTDPDAAARLELVIAGPADRGRGRR